MNKDVTIVVSFDHRGENGKKYNLIHFPPLEGTLSELCKFLALCSSESEKTNKSIENVFAEHTGTSPISIAKSADYLLEFIYPFGYGRLTVYLKDRDHSSIFYGSLEHFTQYIANIIDGDKNGKNNRTGYKFPKTH